MEQPAAIVWEVSKWTCSRGCCGTKLTELSLGTPLAVAETLTEFEAVVATANVASISLADTTVTELAVTPLR